MLIRPEIEADVQSLPCDASELTALIRVCHLSEYVHHSVKRYPEMIGELLADDTPHQTLDENWYRSALDSIIEQDPDVETLRKKMRLLRRREMVRIIYRDFSRLGNLEETTRDLSLLAEASIDTALEYHYRRNIIRFGEPRSETGVCQRMCVLALGKLGARELNLSSDIDLVFLFGEGGSTTGGKSISNQEFFLRTARELIVTLSDNTVEGFVFRVDMRLRPFGKSGALIQSLSAMDIYFQKHGRDWERYAYIKARAVAGDIELGDKFLSGIKPFIYRQHLDYSVIESVRDMKRMIDHQLQLKELHDDLKLGPGGIREIEFIAQANQLVWGGANEKLQERRLQTVLELMRTEQLMPEEDIASLQDAYVFLRNSEHAIQGIHDRQTHMLPRDEMSQQRLAEIMGFADYEAYDEALEQHRIRVMTCFDFLESSNEAERQKLLGDELFWPALWADPDTDEAIDRLSQAGFRDGEAVSQRLAALTSELRELQEVSQQRISNLMPLVLSLVSHQETPDETLERLLPVIEAIGRRSIYSSYLLENTDALKRTVEVCARSTWIAARLKEYPILLYELSDRNTQSYAFEKEKLEAGLDDLIMGTDSMDFETQMDTLRVYRNAVVMRVAVCQTLNLLPLMKASDALTAIAEVIVQKSLDLAWQYLESRHGPPSTEGINSQQHQFAIIAYGKFGGIELSFGSDLDLVFLYDTDIHGQTSGEKPINNNAFFVRLAQRIIHILTSFTRFGMLYEVDMRLRPSGNQGLIVTTINAFEKYQLNEAWVWEHQSIIRSRCVAGHRQLRSRFQAIRNAILEKQRDGSSLKKEVVDMREKMRANLPLKVKDNDAQSLFSNFDLKHETGALVDIEFMVQYLVLARAHQHPELTRWTDVMRLLDEIRDLELLSPDQVGLLQSAYLAYRSANHYQWLGGKISSFDNLHQYREAVFEVWQQKMLR